MVIAVITTCAVWPHPVLCHFVILGSFLFGTILCAMYILQLWTESRQNKKVGKIPYFVHRIGPIVSLGLFSFAFSVLRPLELAGVLLSNLDAAVLLWMLGISALFLIETLNTIHRRNTSAYLRPLYKVHGFILIVFTITAWASVHLYDILFVQIIADSYFLVSDLLSFGLLCHHKYQLRSMMRTLSVTLHMPDLHHKQLHKLQCQTFWIGLFTLLSALFYIYRIVARSEFKDDTDGSDSELSIVSSFFVESGAVTLALWYGWLPVMQTQSKKQETLVAAQAIFVAPTERIELAPS